MKRSLSVCTVALLGALSLAVSGCIKEDGDSPQGNRTVTKEDLLNRTFLLTSIDGKAFTAQEPQRAPSIEFGDDFRVSGATCNRFTGQGELADGVLRIDQMVGTRMLCADQTLNQLETTFYQMLMSGAHVSLNGNYLTLSEGGHVLEYEALRQPR